MSDFDNISSDRPSANPAEDLYGHAPFSKTLAKAIQGYQNAEGLVIALYGPWGSGKSTVLEYVQYELEQVPEPNRQVIVTFNPWWFTGQENLAKSFLKQLEIVLPQKYERFKIIGDKIAEFSDALGGIADIAGKAMGIPGTGAITKATTKALASKQRDVPTLKKDLSALLKQEKKKILVIIDDIDRLSPDEVRQLFTVIKALADFPYVTYLLAFDREVATSAISQQTGLPGAKYLEKIIQVPFELPRPSSEDLRSALFLRLDAVMQNTPDALFDNVYWQNLYWSGLEPLIKVPRDVVRITNALSITYQAVIGEVNPSDFIAIETLRIQIPEVYDVIRSSPESFVGIFKLERHVNDNEEKLLRLFHDDWLNKVPSDLRESTKNLVTRLFPKLEGVWGNIRHDYRLLSKLRSQLRISSPEIFPLYFKLSLSAGAISQAEIQNLIDSKQNPELFADLLRKAHAYKKANNSSKVSELIFRFKDHLNKLSKEDTRAVIEGFLIAGDEILSPKHQYNGDFSFGTESKISHIIYNLIEMNEKEKRAPLIIELMKTASALRCTQYMIALLLSETQDSQSTGEKTLITAEELEDVKIAWCDRMAIEALKPELIDHPKIFALIYGWIGFGKRSEAIAWWKSSSESEDGFKKLIISLVHTVRSHGDDDLVWDVQLLINPNDLSPLFDGIDVSQRLKKLLADGGIPNEYNAACLKLISKIDRQQETTPAVNPNEH